MVDGGLRLSAGLYPLAAMEKHDKGREEKEELPSLILVNTIHLWFTVSSAKTEAP